MQHHAAAAIHHTRHYQAYAFASRGGRVRRQRPRDPAPQLLHQRGRVEQGLETLQRQRGAGQEVDHGQEGALVLAPVFIIFHVLNCFVAMFESLIQGGRLNIVEFRSKFLQGGGDLFIPFSLYTKKL